MKNVVMENIAVVGSTTTGKTELALALAQALAQHLDLDSDLPLINGDEFTMWGDPLLIGTGRSDSARLPQERLNLYGHLSPNQATPTPEEYIELIRPLLAKGSSYVVEGCTTSYMRALKAAIDIPMFGLKPNLTNLDQRMMKRINKAFQYGLVGETERAISAGFRDTFVMKESVVYAPIIELLDGNLSEDGCKAKILEGGKWMVNLQNDRFHKIDGIQWLEHNPNDVQATVDQILKVCGFEIPSMGLANTGLPNTKSPNVELSSPELSSVEPKLPSVSQEWHLAGA